MVGKIRAFLRDEAGATAIEYGLIASFVSLGAIFGMMALSGELGEVYQYLSSTLEEARIARFGS